MDYEKAYKETLDNLQVMVNKGKITENVAKRICSDFKLENEDERIRKAIIEFFKIQDENTTYSFIPRNKILSWLEKKDTEKTEELPNGEDYGIDGIYAAIDILTRTLGEVEGYQSDDGILEHECAISAVKELSKKEQKPAEWTDEDDEMVEDIIDAIPSTYAVSDYNEMVGWLKEVKNRIKPQEKREWNEVDKSNITHCQESLNYYYRSGMITIDEYNSAKNLLNSLITKANWKPTIDQLYAIQTAVSHLDNTPYYEINELKSLHEDLKKLGYEE